MIAQTVRHHWTSEAFLKAHEAGVFQGRVELVEGEVWPVVTGNWHGPATARCTHLLFTPDVVVRLRPCRAQSLGPSRRPARGGSVGRVGRG